MPQPPVYRLADVAREIGADLDTVRATAAEYFALYPSAYNPATATVTDFGRDVLLTVFTNNDPKDEAAPSHT